MTALGNLTRDSAQDANAFGSFLEASRPSEHQATWTKAVSERTGWSSSLKVGVLSLSLLTVSGCAELTPNPEHQGESAEQVTGVDTHSSYPSIRRPEFEQVNLLELIDPHRDAERMFPGAWKAAMARGSHATTVKDRQSSVSLRYDLALAAFRERADTNERNKQVHRNAVQDRIVAVATSRCNVFKTYLRRQQTTSNFWLGSATTVAGVLGAILPGVNAARNLAGVAGGLSGIQAEYNANIYGNTTAMVIARAIDVRQTRLYNQLLEYRGNHDVDTYSMEAAIRDAIEYDGACSTSTGLQELNLSLDELTNPGIPRAVQTITAVRAANVIATADRAGLLAMNQSGELQSLIALTQIGARTAVPAPTIDSSSGASAKKVLKRIETSFRAVNDLDVLIDARAKLIREAFEDAQSNERESSKKSEDPELGKKAQTVFLAGMKKALEIDKGNLEKCVATLKEPYLTVNQKQAERVLAGESVQKKAEADFNLMNETAAASLKAEAVENYVAEIDQFVAGVANVWVVALNKIPTDEAVVTKEFLRVPPKNLWCLPNSK